MFLINRIIRVKIFILMLSIYGLTACTDTSMTGQEQAENQQQSQQMHPFDVNQHALNKVVCDPMGGNGNPGINSGLVAELYYAEQGQRYYDVQSYIDNGTKSSQELFFTDVNVPTRIFDTGFPSQTGSILQNDQGEDLIEFFALRFKSVLKLAEGDVEGDYELAVLSDDGTIMRFTDIQGQTATVVDNDGDHPTQMGCGDVVSFTFDESFDVQLDYYQGPRHHISVIPMWRKVDANTPPEMECGKQGNERYFDLNNNSAPKQTYTDMILRGWKPIAADNWNLPASSIFNPCTDGTPARISNFTVVDLGEGVAQITWDTDLPATSQVLMKDSQGNETMTVSDNVLRTSHSIIISQGINFGEPYIFQGISITADMGKSLSRVLQQVFY